MEPTCICGRTMEFKSGETRTFCKAPGCGVVQKRGPEGYWAYGRTRLGFTPIFTSPQHKPDRLHSYAKWLKKNRMRKVVERC